VRDIFSQTVHQKSHRNKENCCFRFGKHVVTADKDGRPAVLTEISVKVKVKVKFTIEQATKDQRGSKDIALLFP